MPETDVDSARLEIRREAFTMAFYVAVCLVVALAALDDRSSVPIFGIIWGTTIGLGLAHLFAFRLAARIVSGGRFGQHEVPLAVAQLAGATAVAVVATLPLLFLTPPTETDVTRLVLAGLIALPAYAMARSDGAPRMRSILFALGVLVVATFIAVVKNLLLGH